MIIFITLYFVNKNLTKSINILRCFFFHEYVLHTTITTHRHVIYGTTTHRYITQYYYSSYYYTVYMQNILEFILSLFVVSLLLCGPFYVFASIIAVFLKALGETNVCDRKTGKEQTFTRSSQVQRIAIVLSTVEEKHLKTLHWMCF